MHAVFPEIRTDNLFLRRFEDNDLPKVFEGLSHPDVISHYGVSFSSLDDTRSQMAWFKNIEADGSGLWWAVCSADGKIFYGAGGLNSISKEHRNAEIGFWLLPEFWGRSIMQEAMPLIVNHGFSKMNLHRIEGLVEHDNLKCKSAMAKLNFKYEGTMHDCEIKNEKFISLDIYAVLNKPDPEKI